MKRSLLGLLASLVLGVSAVVTTPSAVLAGAAGADVAQVQPADHGGDDEEKEKKGKKDDGEDKKKQQKDDDDKKDDGDRKKDDGDRKKGHKGGDGDDGGDGNGNRCVGLIVICLG